MYLRKIYLDKTNDNSISESSTNILQIQAANNSEGVQQLIDDLKKDVKYLNLKSFTAEKNLKQYNFWFDINPKDLSIFLKKIEEITSRDKDVKIQVYSRSGIYE